MNGRRPLVSIITPSFQQGEYLADNLRSIREQSYAHIEHIVRDGGSTDKTLQILRAADVRWVSQPDRGQTDALNSGLAEANGEVIGWVNSDDYLYPKAVEIAVDVLEKTGADAVYGRCLLVDAHGEQIGFYNTEPFSYRRLLVRNIIAQPAVFLRRRVYERFGPLDERLSFAMDYEYWLRCARDASFTYIPQLFAAYRIHPAAKTATGAMKHAAEANDLRMRYGRGVAPTWQLWLACLRTYIGGLAKSSTTGLKLLRYASWQRARD
jgi:glycosyltransferase involved in cell wall biosynthesis